MRVRIWNAYASNNSGSYTIVGTLPSEEVAKETARELSEMIQAHTAWFEAGETDSVSPLEEFIRKNQLTWMNGRGTSDNWPEHEADNRPRVVVNGAQLMVHHPYTVSLPPTFGELFYKRGGSVDHVEDHAHHPIAVEATYWWGWTKENLACMAAERPGLLAAIVDPQGALASGKPSPWPMAWRVGEPSTMEMPLVVGIVFDDIVAGVETLRQIAEQHQAKMRVKIFEMRSEHHDPFNYLRPSAPPPEGGRFDLLLEDSEMNRPVVAKAICEALGATEWDVRHRMMEMPMIIARGLSRPRAEAIAKRLTEAGPKPSLCKTTHDSKARID